MFRSVAMLHMVYSMFMTYIRTKSRTPSSSAPLARRITLKSQEASLTGAVGMTCILSRPVTTICITPQSTVKNPAFSPRVHLCILCFSEQRLFPYTT